VNATSNGEQDIGFTLITYLVIICFETFRGNQSILPSEGYLIISKCNLTRMMGRIANMYAFLLTRLTQRGDPPPFPRILNFAYAVDLHKSQIGDSYISQTLVQSPQLIQFQSKVSYRLKTSFHPAPSLSKTKTICFPSLSIFEF
jgi:hypothetical protein